MTNIKLKIRNWLVWDTDGSKYRSEPVHRLHHRVMMNSCYDSNHLFAKKNVYLSHSYS